MSTFAHSDTPGHASAITHAQAIGIARSHESAIAWPTLVMAVLAAGGFWTVAFWAATGALSLWWAMPLNVFLAYSCYTPLHEACHRNITASGHRHAWLNNVVGNISATPFFGSFHLHQLTHLAHHAHTNDPAKDPDQWMVSHNAWSLLWRSMTVFMVHNIVGVKLALGRSDGRWRLANALVRVSVCLGIVAWMALRWDATAVLLTTIAAALLASMLLAVVFDWLPHHPHTSQDRWQHTRVVTFAPGVQGALDQLLYGQTYHLIHHLYPRVPFYRYKAVFTKLRGFFESNGAQIYPAGSQPL
jgi:beta-carotene hydroxylase